MTAEFYQTLVDRCWRRSGTLLYRPNQKDACCPHYTLRLDAPECGPARDQRHAVNRFNRFVLGEDYIKEVARKFPLTREQARERESSFHLVERVHEAEQQRIKPSMQPAHEFTITLEPDDFTEEKFAIYENYQSVVHREDPSSITQRGFKRFLCGSPIRRETYVDENGSERQVGSFHQCYRLDGELVAVGVLDLLPHAVSAVYFMYHEAIQKHQPGKLGALTEIALAIEGGYRYWYPGYYIHSCPKMKYKIDYSPQYVLDPETLSWDLLDKEALAIFDRQPYVSLSAERVIRDENGTDIGSDSQTERRTTTSATQDQDSGRAVPEAYGEDEHMEEERNDENHDDDYEDEDDPISLFNSNMPGIPSLSELETCDLDHIKVLSDHNSGYFTTGQATVWSTASIRDFGSLKSKIAELAAALGPDLLPQIVLDFRK